MFNFLKRVIDILISGITLIILSPLFLIVIFLLSVTGEREIFYLQKRVGHKNEFFSIIKFATMLKNSPNMGTGSLTVRNDPRVTPVGRILRKTKINELPQVINVLRGDMSIVGPRPQMEVDFLAYPKHVQDCIYNVRPGVTGIGSIIFRDEEKLISESDLAPREIYEKFIAPYKGEVEMWYQANASVWVDIKLIFCTAWVILFSKSRMPYILFPTLPRSDEFEAALAK